MSDLVWQRHIVGGKDQNVPEAVNRRYFDALRPDQVWRYPGFDHACCWVEHWSSILARIDQAITSGAGCTSSDGKVFTLGVSSVDPEFSTHD